MTAADTAGAWIAARLTWLPDTGERLLTVPLLVLLTYWALRILVGLVLRLLLERLVYRVIPGIVHVGAVSLLAVEFLATQVSRLVRARPAGALYGFGNGVVRTDGRLSALSRSTVDTVGRLRAVPRILLAVLAVYLAYRWGQGFCSRSTASPCVSPTVVWWTEVGSIFSFLTR